MELDELVELTEVLLIELDVLEIELLVELNEVDVLLIDVLELVELTEVELVEVELIELLVELIEVEELVELILVEEVELLVELILLLVELNEVEVDEVDRLVDVEEKDVLVELTELEVLEIDELVELTEVELIEVEEVEVVVPVGDKKKVAMAQTHWIEELAPKLADCTPPVVTNKSSAATATTRGAPTDTRLTKFPPAEKVWASGINPAPISSSLFWVNAVVLPEFRELEFPVLLVCLSKLFA